MKNRNLKLLLYKRFCSAFRGYILWHNIVRRNKISNHCAVIFLPSTTDEECASYAVKYLEAFFRCNPEFKETVFLSCYLELDTLIARYHAENYVKQVVQLSKKNTANLIDFYNIYLNDHRFVVASLDLPQGRNGLDYLHTGVLNKEEIFLMGIYNVTKGPEIDQFSI